MDFKDAKFYGTTTVGEKGQVVLPADLRRNLKIETGEKLAVLVIEKIGISGIVMVESKILTSIIEKVFGGKLDGILGIKKSNKS